MAFNPYSLEGKTVLVTGASSGIGKATAIACSRLGAHVIVSGRNSERLQETFSELDGEGHLQIIARSDCASCRICTTIGWLCEQCRCRQQDTDKLH